MNKLLCLMGWHDWENLPAWSCWSGLCSMLLNFYSYYLYVRSMIQELVLNDRLNVWIKGHLPAQGFELNRKTSA